MEHDAGTFREGQSLVLTLKDRGTGSTGGDWGVGGEREGLEGNWEE